MNERVKSGQLFRMPKYSCADGSAVELTILINRLAKQGLNRTNKCRIFIHQGTRRLIGIEYRNAKDLEDLTDRRLAAAYAAGDAHFEHNRP